MKYSVDILKDWLNDYYLYEYTDVPPEFKVKTIEYVIQNNHKIFDNEYVQSRYHYCEQCGFCCREQGFCEHFDDKTSKCLSHDEQRSIFCKIFPRPGEFGLYLSINCVYVVKIFLEFLDNVFEKKSLEIKNDKQK